MLLLILALQTAQSPSDAVLNAARRAVTTLADTAAVRAAQYRPITEIGVPDGVPFQGRHWFVGSDTLPDVPMERPSFVMFSPVGGVLRRVGVAYAARLGLEEPAPPGLGGDPSAEWHDHFWCNDVPGAPRGFVVNVAEQCKARGGTLDPRRTTMVHVWTDVPSPEGVYGHDNPALPFLAVGLAPPTAHDLHDRARARTMRALGMALGETYDARLPVANRIMRQNTNAAMADSVAGRRAAIRGLIPALKAAESSGDRRAYEGVAGQIIAEWEALLGLYGRMAATPQLQAQVGRANERVLTVSAHH